MEFPFTINHLFDDNISVIDSRLLPCKNHSLDKLKANLERVIDDMGLASAKAQGLNGPITSAHKMRFTNHKLYVVKDCGANRGNGAVVGILKLGRKKLFVLDKHGNQNEMEPLCVLDFYVHESCQRKGYGKQLFEYMLKVENAKVPHLAIDRPSHKFTSFLMKHYNLSATIPQVNNFVVFDGFMTNHPEEGYCRNRRVGSGKPPIAPNTRQSPIKPHGGYRNASQWSPGSGPLTNQTHNQSRWVSNPDEIDALKNVRISPVGLNRSVSASSLSSSGSAEAMFGDAAVDPRSHAAHTNRYSRYNIQSGTPPPRRRSASRSRESQLANTPTQNTPPSMGICRTDLRSRGNTPPFGAVSLRMLNTHVETQGRKGHLNITPKATSTTNLSLSPSNTHQAQPTSNPNISTQGLPNMSMPNSAHRKDLTTPEGNYNLCSAWKPRIMHSSWNVMGIPPAGSQRNSSNRNQVRTTNRFY